MPHTPPLFGLVLAGGASRRMGRDKATLVYHGDTQLVHCWRLLASICAEAFVSTNPGRAGDSAYSGLPLILDDRDFEGPLSGLVAAWERHPSVAWLVLAVDMPLADRRLLTDLIAARNPTVLATAFQRDDGIIEPLCAIWEPAARDPLDQAIRAGHRSPRRFLESAAVSLLRPAQPEKLTSVNSPQEYEAARRRLGGPEKAREKGF